MDHADGPYVDLARRLWATGLISDPWVDGAPRFSLNPLILSRTRIDALYEAAERIAVAYDDVTQLCVSEPALLTTYFHLTPWQCAMWAANDAAWHGIARADVFFTPDGPRICELNSDTPTGQVESTVLAALLNPNDDTLEDPNARLLGSIADLVAHEATRIRSDSSEPYTIGILYPTDLPEDLGLVALYRRTFNERGWQVVLGSPHDLSPAENDRVALRGTCCDVIFRHYKTDAWGERSSPWLDVPPPHDALPLEGPLRAVLRSVQHDRCAVINPFGSVLTQNKRAMALMWEARDRLSPEGRDAVERFMPYTARLEAVSDELNAKDNWVLKSDYGCEGDEVVIGRDVTHTVWHETIAMAKRGRWIAQRWFDAERDASGLHVNHGVYVVAGRACGLYARLHRGATDRRSLSTATFVRHGT